LRQNSGTSQLPWCIIGDFNEVDNLDWLINGFKEVVTDAELIDIFTLRDILSGGLKVLEQIERSRLSVCAICMCSNKEVWLYV
jgi:hypothetical protein